MVIHPSTPTRLLKKIMSICEKKKKNSHWSKSIGTSSHINYLPFFFCGGWHPRMAVESNPKWKPRHTKLFKLESTDVTVSEKQWPNSLLRSCYSCHSFYPFFLGNWNLKFPHGGFPNGLMKSFSNRIWNCWFQPPPICELHWWQKKQTYKSKCVALSFCAKRQRFGDLDHQFWMDYVPLTKPTNDVVENWDLYS